MKKTLILDIPVLINGKERKEFDHDAQEINTELFLEACRRAEEANYSKVVSFKQKENETILHMYLGMAAVIAVNPDISFEDLSRVKGFDILKFADIGWFFILRTSEEASKENNSDGRSENTAEHSTPAQENLESED